MTSIYLNTKTIHYFCEDIFYENIEFDKKLKFKNSPPVDAKYLEHFKIIV